MRYTRSAITRLTQMYRSILLKCAWLNAAVFVGVTGIAENVMAEVPTVLNPTRGNDAAYSWKQTGANTSIPVQIGNDEYYVDIDKTTYTKGEAEHSIEYNWSSQNHKLNIPDLVQTIQGGDYIYNNVNNSAGGALSNPTGDVAGYFIGNYANAGYGGGGIAKTSGTLNSVTGLFVGNHGRYGGAITNSGATINSINADFIGNYTTGSYMGGGAIMLYASATIGNAIGDFIGNYADDTGGAISNTSSTITSLTGNFIANKSTSSGGAIYNTGTINLYDSSFIGNIAPVNYGAAIYSTGNISITAQNKDVLFENNNSNGTSTGTGTGIHNTGTITFNANNNHKIEINDSMNLGGTSNVNLNSGTLKLGQKAANTTFTKLTVSEDDSTLDLQNDNATDVVTFSTLAGSGELKLNVDYDAAQNNMDKITVNNGSGSIKLNAVNITADNESFVDGTETTYLDGSAKANITVSGDITSTVYDGYVYEFTPDTTNHGLVSVSRALEYTGDLINAVADDVAEMHPNAYSMRADFEADRALGALNNENRPDGFTIFGNNHKILGENNTGIKVASGDILNINKVAEFSGASDYAIDNGGTLNITNSTFTNNDTADINNNGTVNFTGTNSLDKITGEGAFYVDGGVTTVEFVDQDEANVVSGELALTGTNNISTVNLSSDATLTVDKDAVSSLGTNSALVANGGTLNLANNHIDSLTLAHSIDNIGGLKLALDVDLSATSVVSDIITASLSNTTSPIYLSSLNFINDDAENGEFQIADGSLKDAIQLATDFDSGIYATANYNNTTGVLSLSDRVIWFRPTLGSESGYKFTKENTGIIPVTYGDKTFYTDIKKKNYINGDISYTWDNENKKLTATNSGASTVATLDGTKYVGDTVGITTSTDTSAGGALVNNAEITCVEGDFVNNTIQRTYGGGALFNQPSGNIATVKGNFIGNLSKVTYGYANAGSAIDNRGTIGTITGDFIGNTSTGKQGAIYNAGTITEINGDFIGNNDVNGAIYNAGTMKDINGNFIANNSTSTGGGIYNNGSITGKIKGIFYANNATQGPAIYNYNGHTINEIEGTFTDNVANSSGGALFIAGNVNKIDGIFENNTATNGEGGAIYASDYTPGATGSALINVGSIEGTFKNNTASNNGGAIYSRNKLDNLTGVFENNTAGASGGAIYSSQHNSSDVLNISDSTFSENIANGTGDYIGGGAIWNGYKLFVDNSTFEKNSAIRGGAIYNSTGYNRLASLNITDSSFIGNIATSGEGGAIYQVRESGAGKYIGVETTIYAKDQNIEFTNNNSTGTATGVGTGIYVDYGTLNLNADEGRKIVINDNIYSAATNNINANESNTGTVELNGQLTNSMSMTLNRGILKLGQEAATSTFSALNIAGNSTLDLQNNHAGDVLTITNYGGNAKTLNLNLDYDAENNVMDKLTVNGVSSATVANNIVTLNAVNVVNDGENFVDGTETTYLDGTKRANITVIEDAINSATDTGYLYTFTPDTTTHGLLSVARKLNYDGDLINAINDDYGTLTPNSFSLSEDFAADRAFGNLNNENRTSFTIFGNGNNIARGAYDGITVSSGDILNVNGVADFSGTSDYAINNAGTLKFSGTNTVDKVIGTGVTDVDGGKTTIANLTQGTVNINSGELVLIDTNNITTANLDNDATLTVGGNAVSSLGTNSALVANGGTLNLANNHIDSLTLAHSIDNIGGLKLALDVDLSATSVVSDIITASLNNTTSPIYLSSLSFINDDAENGELHIADGTLKSVLALANDFDAGIYATATYDNTTGVLSLSDRINWLKPTLGSDSAYKFTKENTGIIPVAYGDKTFYTDIKKTTYGEDDTELKYTWANNQLTVKNSDNTALTPTIREGVEYVGKTGGVLSNPTGDITADFVGNSGSYGTAINNAGNSNNIGSITGNFIGNSASGYAGVLRHDSSTGEIGEIVGDFIGNRGTGGSYGGGAILTYSSGKIGLIKGDFIGNYQNAQGGAIYNYNTNIDSILGNFIKNKSTSYGGAISNLSGTINIANSSFIGNEAAGSVNYGGAIYNEANDAIINLTDTSFIGNVADRGAAIYNDRGTVTITAKNRDVEFTDNVNATANGNGYGITSYNNSSVLNLNAAEGKEVTINDKIYVAGTLNINSDATYNDGTIELNGAYDNSGTTNLAGGTLQLGTTPATSTIQALNVTGDATLSLQNDHAGDVLTVTTYGGNENTLNLNLDYDATLNVMDKLKVNNVSSSTKADNIITLNAINVINTPDEYADDTEATYLDGNAKDNITTRTTAYTTIADGYAYTFTPDSETTGLLSISRKLHYDGDLINAILDNVGTMHPTAYSLSEDFTADRAFGSLNNADRTAFTIFGNGNSILGDSNTGIKVAEGSTLTISGVDEFSGASDYAVDNAGTLNVEDSTFVNNTTADINNTDTLNLDGTNSLSKITGTAGTANVVTGATTVGQITQKVINIESDATLTANGNVIVGTGTGEGIVNATENGLTVNGGVLTGKVAGDGSTQFTGTSSIASGSVVNQAVTIASGTLTANTSNFGSTITNAGTLNLSGTLSKAVAGTTGVTKVNEALVMTSAGSVAGTLDLNDGTLNLAGDEAVTEQAVNKLLGDGSIKIDIDYTGETPIADAINIAVAGDTERTITVSDITEIGTTSDSFTVQVLKGATDNITLALSDELAAAYQGDEVTDITYEAEDFAADIDFDKLSFDTIEYTEKKQKTLSVDGTSLQLAVNVTEAKHQTGVTQADALATLNTTSGSRSMKATTTESSNAYQLTQNLGTTAAGDITIEGRSATDLAELDMNGKIGFAVSKADTTVNLKNVEVVNAKTETGSLINITNSTAEANLDGVVVAENTANVIASNGTVNIKDSTINAGIANTGEVHATGTNALDKLTGEGTFYVDGGVTTIDFVEQDSVSVAENSGLTVSSMTTANGVDNDGTLTLTGTANANAITGDGHTVIANNMTNTGTISQEVTINSNKTLTTAADKIGGAVTNGGIVNLTGGTLAQQITGGTTKISGTVQNNTTMTNMVEIASGGTLKTAANGFSNDITTNAGTIELTGGTLNKTIAGTTKISGNVTNNGTLENVTVTGTLTSSADDISGTVANSGTYNVTDGTIAQNVTGNGALVVAGDVVNNAQIANNITINNGQSLESNASNVTGTVTGGTYKVTGGTIGKAVSGGNLIVEGAVANNAVISSAITINNDKSLTSSADNIQVAITNNGTYNINGGTIGNAVNGGITNIIGDAIWGDGADLTTSNTIIANNGSLDIGTNQVTLGDAVINGTLKMGITNLSDASSDYTGGKLTAHDLTLGSSSKLALTVASGLMTEKGQSTEGLDLINVTGTKTGDFAELMSNNRYQVTQTEDGKFKITYTSSAADVTEAANGSTNNVKAAQAWDSFNAPEGTPAAVVQEYLNELSQHDAVAYTKALTDLAPTDSLVHVGVTQDFNNMVDAQVADRLQTQGMNSGDVFERQGAWVQTLYNRSKQHAADQMPGFRGHTKGVAFGLDGKKDSQTMVGVGYAYGNTDVESAGRDTDIASHNFYVYGKYQPSEWFVRAMAMYGIAKYEEKANIGGVVNKGDYNVQNMGASAYVGYDWQDGITPEAGLRYTHIKRDDYTDTVGQRIRADDVDILTAVAGINFASTVENETYTFTPRARVALTYDLLSDDSNATVNVGTNVYNVTGEKLDRIGLEAGVGVDVDVEDWTLSAEYNANLRQGYTSHTGSLKAKYNF